ncbi:hypothetical protein, partial [Aquiflexum sp.]|uniref:hypothetical protein n=1 Tax=Aquiflexum sp. TaxID=1872584 RepID=UPI0035939B38
FSNPLLYSPNSPFPELAEGQFINLSLVGTRDLQRSYLCSNLSFPEPREMLLPIAPIAIGGISMTAVPIYVIGSLPVHFGKEHFKSLSNLGNSLY